MKRSTILAALGAAALLAGCKLDGSSEGAHRESKATDQLMNAASTAVGMPAIQNFTEKRQLKMLYELRDNAKLVTYTYYVDMQGRRHKVCPTTSVGYGLPFSAQFTAPERPDYASYQDNAVIMQPEPNGLYMPDATSATWVICLHPDGKRVVPVYVEPAIIVSGFPLD